MLYIIKNIALEIYFATLLGKRVINNLNTSFICVCMHKDKSGIIDFKMFIWWSNQKWSLSLVSEIIEFFHLLLSVFWKLFFLKIKEKKPTNSQLFFSFEGEKVSSWKSEQVRHVIMRIRILTLLLALQKSFMITFCFFGYVNILNFFSEIRVPPVSYCVT